MHIVLRPTALSWRSSSSSSVPISMAPVAPSGCPSAIAPPLTFTFACGIPTSSIVMRGTAANASLISTRSTSAMVSWLRRSIFCVAGMGPVIMLTGPIPATQKILRRSQLTIADVDLVEINEAFAAVPLITMEEVGIPHAKVNVNGGAIALGHPLGATGAMLIGTLLDELERQDKAVGLSTMCIGYGMGIATIIERV